MEKLEYSFSYANFATRKNKNFFIVKVLVNCSRVTVKLLSIFILTT